MNAQADKKYIRKGNKEYEKNKFAESEISYKKARDENKQSSDAVFNVGDALYKQNKFDEAGKQFVENINENDDKVKKSTGLYNLGNSLLKANKLQESIALHDCDRRPTVVGRFAGEDARFQSGGSPVGDGAEPACCKVGW